MTVPAAEHAVPAGSMADIASLLLIFFFATTQICDEKGIKVTLPPIDARGAVSAEIASTAMSIGTMRSLAGISSQI